MWVVGYRNLPYAGQDTNAAIEGYHGFLKSVLKAERSCMVAVVLIGQSLPSQKMYMITSGTRAYGKIKASLRTKICRMWLCLRS